MNPESKGTKASPHYRTDVEPGQFWTFRLRLSDLPPAEIYVAKKTHPVPFGSSFYAVMQARRREADEFDAGVIPSSFNDDSANVMRQALAGMLWSKQLYFYDV